MGPTFDRSLTENLLDKCENGLCFWNYPMGPTFEPMCTDEMRHALICNCKYLVEKTWKAGFRALALGMTNMNVNCHGCIRLDSKFLNWELVISTLPVGRL